MHFWLVCYSFFDLRRGWISLSAPVEPMGRKVGGGVRSFQRNCFTVATIYLYFSACGAVVFPMT